MEKQPRRSKASREDKGGAVPRQAPDRPYSEVVAGACTVMSVVFGLGALSYMANSLFTFPGTWIFVVLSAVFLKLRQLIVNQGQVKTRKATFKPGVTAPVVPVAPVALAEPLSAMPPAPVQEDAAVVRVGRSG